ncbi:response regulator [Acanthopleuribacter pedis]|uniref:Response regulator n=1 Tax=Acanthopleuribacter pedis TaxID=442870 RepID=A0A8J7U4V1_9BACT|nr:response regulator [Acanthopleuribacter pedis]MBO1321843.1 response regulator [Acanthopleuribacter pedis]
MEAGSLSHKLMELIKQGEDQTLQLLLKKILSDFRDTALLEIADLLSKVEGKVRLKILSYLIEDGGVDLIPLFAQRIREERNTLYAKSMITLFGNFKQKEALRALEELEPNLHPDLKSTYQRIIGRFRGIFREAFYMDEFVSGNNKRMKFAANTMIREPNPEYIPFLNEKLLDGLDTNLQLEAVRVLAEIGDQSTLEACFTVLEQLRDQFNHRTRYVSFLQRAEAAKLEEREMLTLIAKAMDHDSEDTILALWYQAKEARKPAIVPDAINQHFMFQSKLIADENRSFWKSLVLGSPMGRGDLSKMDNALSMYGEQLAHLQRDTLAAMGQIALKHQVDNLIERLDGLLPESGENRDRLMIAVLSGHRSEESKAKLMAYSAGTYPIDILEKVITALSFYTFDSMPEGLKTIAVSHDHTPLRRQTQVLLGDKGYAGAVAQALLGSEKLLLRSEAIGLIGEYKIQEGFDALIKLLQQKLPDSLRIEVFKSLEVFPASATGDAVEPFIGPQNTMSLREAALQCMILAGGPARLGKIAAMMDSLNDKKFLEVCEPLLNLLLNLEIDSFESAFYEERPLWCNILSKEATRVREKLLQLFEKLHWSTREPQQWISDIQAAIHNKKADFSSLDERRLRAVIAKLNAKLLSLNKSGQKQKVLIDVLENYQKADHNAKVQSMRKLNVVYKADLIDPDSDVLPRLVSMVLNFIDTTIGESALTALGVTVAGRIGHPQLKERAEHFLKHEDPLIAKAAHKALNLEFVDAATMIRTIYIVDDSRYITKQLSSVLSKAGYEVSAENKPPAALETLGRQKFDVLILDLHMPELDGITLLKKIQAAKRVPPHVLIITASRDRTELATVVAAGIEGLLLKPFPMADLLNKIKIMDVEK